jgi:simple sugar transport system permease protein
MGALGAAVAGLFLKDIPTPLHLSIVFLASFFAGALWGGIAGFLRVRYSTNEIVVTLLMNFIAVWIIFYMIRYPLRGETAWNPVTANISESARLPIILPGTTLHAGILIALALSFIIWFGLRSTTLGYRIHAVGSNPEAALYGGISIHKMVMITISVGGGVAGLAGMSQVSGIQHMLRQSMSFDYGYLAIPAALLARLNPIGAIFASLFLGGLLTGGRVLQVGLGVPSTIVYMIMAVFILALLLEPYFDKLLHRVLKTGY